MKPGYKKRLLMLGLLLTAMIGSSAAVKWAEWREYEGGGFQAIDF